MQKTGKFYSAYIAHCCNWYLTVPILSPRIGIDIIHGFKLKAFKIILTK